MSGPAGWRFLLGGIVDGLLMSVFVALAAGLTWVLGV